MARTKPQTAPTTPTVSSADEKVSLRIRLDESTYRHFETLAAATGTDPEDLIARHIKATKLFEVAERPIYLTDAQRREIETMFGKMLDGKSLVAEVRKALTMSIEDVGEITLRPQLIERLRSRCFDGKPAEFIKRNTVEQLERQRQDASRARRALATAERTLIMRTAHRDRLRHDLGR